MQILFSAWVWPVAGGEIPVDAELQQWEEDWDAAG